MHAPCANCNVGQQAKPALIQSSAWQCLACVGRNTVRSPTDWRTTRVRKRLMREAAASHGNSG
eukprot:5042601-Alexandrium_andersonii.AAC.1